MKLSETEKKEMLEDADNNNRMAAFRKLRTLVHYNSFEEYISWLDEIQSINPIKSRKININYKRAKI